MRNVFLTGATGTIGSVLVPRLLQAERVVWAEGQGLPVTVHRPSMVAVAGEPPPGG
ncbi:MAG: hypothetical protein Q8M01_10185 [Rubrivivax sp.]|nr:hypothetical protein [Rubrivivax sp.]